MEKKRTKQNRAGRRSAAKPLFCVLVVFAAIFVIERTVGNVALSNVSDAVLSFVSSVGDGSSYPYSAAGQNVKEIKRIGHELMLVKNEGITILDFSSSVLLNLGLKYSDAAVSVKNGRAVVFDRNANKFCVTGKTKSLYPGETKGAILTAVMGKNGYVAVATLSEDAASELTVYDRGMKEYFKWKCVSDYIADMSISDNGKNIAVIVLGVRDAEIFSKLWVFEMGSGEPLASFEYGGTTLVDVEYTGKKQIVVLGDNLRSVISPDMTRKDESFSGNTLGCFASAENGRQAVVLLPYGKENTPKLCVYAKDGTKSFEESFFGRITDVACSSSHAAVLVEDKIYSFDSVGRLAGIAELDEKASGIEILATAGAVYALFDDRIEKYATAAQNS